MVSARCPCLDKIIFEGPEAGCVSVVCHATGPQCLDRSSTACTQSRSLTLSGYMVLSDIA